MKKENLNLGVRFACVVLEYSLGTTKMQRKQRKQSLLMDGYLQVMWVWFSLTIRLWKSSTGKRIFSKCSKENTLHLRKLRIAISKSEELLKYLSMVILSKVTQSLLLYLKKNTLKISGSLAISVELSKNSATIQKLKSKSLQILRNKEEETNSLALSLRRRSISAQKAWRILVAWQIQWNCNDTMLESISSLKSTRCTPLL